MGITENVYNRTAREDMDRAHEILNMVFDKGVTPMHILELVSTVEKLVFQQLWEERNEEAV